MCIRMIGTDRSATTSSMFGSCLPPETSFTISAPASIAAAATAELLVSMEIKHRSCRSRISLLFHLPSVRVIYRPIMSSMSPDDRDHSIQFIISAYYRSARSCGLSADVDHVRPVKDHLRSLLEGCLDIQILPTIRETVRSHVQHSGY